MLGTVRRLAKGQEAQFFVALQAAQSGLATAWWALVILRGVLPALFALAMGQVVSVVERHGNLTMPLILVGALFVALQILPPFHTAIGASLGDRTAAWLFDRLARACDRMPGIGHLENPALAQDLSMARDFDLGITAPPLFVSMDFIAQGLVDLLSGACLAILLFGYAWWAGILIGGAWLSTHWLLRESTIWRDRNTDEVRAAQRESDYGYRMAVMPEPAKELRLFGLSDWTVERFVARRRRLFDLQYHATRLREQPLILSMVIVMVANLIVLYAVANSAADGHLSLGQVIVYVQATVGASLIAFGGINWALDGSAAPVAAAVKLDRTLISTEDVPGYLPETSDPDGRQRVSGTLRFDAVSFGYAGSPTPVLRDLTIDIPRGSSIAIVGENGAGKTTLAKLICRLYDPTSGRIEVDGLDIRSIPLFEWRRRIAAVFQDYIRYELTLRENVAPMGAADEIIIAALHDAGAAELANLDVPLSKAYDGGIDLSGGQWQRIALARALCAVRQGADIVILDEPTAQLDVRGEAEIFDRLLSTTAHCTTILVSHRFSTVRKADKIVVVEDGRAIEAGSHDHLLTLGGRYATMFNLQAQRFLDETDEEGTVFDTLD